MVYAKLGPKLCTLEQCNKMEGSHISRVFYHTEFIFKNKE